MCQNHTNIQKNIKWGGNWGAVRITHWFFHNSPKDMPIVCRYMCNKKASKLMNSTGKFIQFLMPVTIYLKDSIQIGIFICKLVTHKIFQLTKAYMLTLLLIYYVSDQTLLRNEKKIGGSILTSMAELIFNSFLFKNFLAVPQKIPFDKLLHTNRNPYQIKYVKSAIFLLEKT